MTRRLFIQLVAWMAAALCVRPVRAAKPPACFEFPLWLEGDL